MAILETEASLTRTLVQRLDEYIESSEDFKLSLQKIDLAQMQPNSGTASEDFNARVKEPVPSVATTTKKLYASLRNAVADFVSKQILSQTQQDIIDAMMAYRDDRNLQAAWEVY